LLFLLGFFARGFATKHYTKLWSKRGVSAAAASVLAQINAYFPVIIFQGGFKRSGECVALVLYFSGMMARFLSWWLAIKGNRGYQSQMVTEFFFQRVLGVGVFIFKKPLFERATVP